MQQARKVAIAGLQCGVEGRNCGGHYGMWQLPWVDQGCYCAVWGCVNSTPQLFSGSVATVLSGSNTVGAPGEKMGGSCSQGIRGSVGNIVIVCGDLI